MQEKNFQDARIKVATILNARPEEIIFTSGGTESNNLAIQGIIFGRPTSEFWTPRIQVSNTRQNRQKSLPHIITTNIEHPSVLETCKILEKRGLAEISIISVEKNGIVDPKKIKKEIKKNTVLVSVNYANNEIGTIQPIKEIAKEIRHYKKSRLAEFSQVTRISFASTLGQTVRKFSERNFFFFSFLSYRRCASSKLFRY